MTKKEKVIIIVRKLKRLFPDAKIVLCYGNPWELLVAVMLSAQCTDVMVNRVTKTLFKKYRTLDDYVKADIREFEKDIHSTGFYRVKAKHILEAAQIVRHRFGGRVPSSMEHLISLPGVARKTANVVLGNAYGIVEGIAVDTHVIRLSRVWGLTQHKDPQKIEKDLMGLLPRDEWFGFTYLTIEYGRKYCIARKHHHERCPLTGMINDS